MINGTKWKIATLSCTLIVLAVMDTAPPAVWAQASTPYAQINAEAASSTITVKPVRGSVTVLEGSGGNIAILSGAEGLLMVDAGIAVSAAKLETALQGIASSPIKYVINTHWHWDHTDGNGWVHRKGATIIAHENTAKHLRETIRVSEWGHTFTPIPAGDLPTRLIGRSEDVAFGGETVRMRYYGPAHTDGDLSIYFANADVLATGDTWWNGLYPFIDYVDGKGWHNARVMPYGPIELDPSAIVLHYAQEVFEGLKAYRWADGSIVSFRPEANARRLRSSARRLAIPELPEEVFIESLRQLIAVDAPWVPPAGGEESLYLRPYIFATEPGLGVRPASEYRYMVIASPVGAYFKGGIKPVSVWLSTEYVRACPGGTGAAKFGGNYAASLLAQAQAIENDCDQVVWLDAAERRYVEEMGGMNLFFVFGSGGTARLVTPELSGSILPGVTRDALLQLATDAGFAVEERKIDVDEWQKKAAAGEITEVFACGTAAVITPVARVKYGDGEFTVADGGPGEITMALRDTLTGIQRGTFADTHGWMARLS